MRSFILNNIKTRTQTYAYSPLIKDTEILVTS